MMLRAGVTEEFSATSSPSGRQARLARIGAGLILFGLLVFPIGSLAAGEKTYAAVSRCLKSVKGLVSQLSSQSGQTRIRAAEALGGLGADAALAAPALTRALRDREHEMRWTAALALGRIGAGAAKATPALVQALGDSSPHVRWTVPGVLVAIQARSELAVPALARALGDWNPLVRAAAAQALSAFGHDGVNALKRALLSPNESVRQAAQQALRKVASTADGRTSVDVGRSWSTRQWVTPMWLLLACYTGWFAIWVLLLERSPQKALQLCQSVKRFDRRTHLPLTRLLFLGTIGYTRLLDAWVAANALRVRGGFLSRPTVRERRLFVQMPVILGNSLEASLNADALRNLSSFPMHLLIWGEGDSGKTALACRVAEGAVSDDRSQHFGGHRMLPVLIEDEVTLYTGRGRHPLVTAIKDQLELTLGRSRPLTDELLQALLKTGRLLVIIDGFSEMTQQSRQLLDPSTPGFPRTNLLITSRQKERLGDTEVVVKTRLLDKDLLIIFLRSYVQQRENTARAREMTIAETARTLVRLANWRRVSPGVAKLYLEQVLGGLMGSASIPDLVAAYVYQLGDDMASSLVTLAWESLHNDFRPMSIPRDRALTRIGGADPGVTLRRLEEEVGMVQTLRPSKFHIRFVLNFIAEYLAAYYLLERNASAETPWRKFLAQVDSKQEASVRIRPFLSALLDCLLTGENRYDVPRFVRLELAKRLEIDVASLVPADVEDLVADEASQRKPKSERYQVAEPRESGPATGAQNRLLPWPATMVFGTMGVQGVPALLKALNDQDAAVRGAGIDALSQMGAAAHVAIPELIKALDDPDPDIPWRAANALGTMGSDAAAALTNALREKRGEVRRLVVDALGEIGAGAKVAIPVLVQLLERDNEAELRWRAADALGAMGAQAKSAVPVLRRLVTDEDKSVCAFAQAALTKIAPDLA
ncbi:MAG: HEAT repeat domain-containing protein [Gammaproteobacteria bacterium]